MATIKDLLGKMIEKINTIPKKVSDLEIDTELGVKSWNDLEDKPFYDTRKTTQNTQTISLTFDGSLDGKEYIEIAEGVYSVKISDTPLTLEQIIGGTSTLSNGDSWKETKDYVWIEGNNIIFGDDYMCSVLKEEFEYSVGVWFICLPDYNEYPVSFKNTITTTTEFGQLQQIDTKYLPYHLQFGEETIMHKDVLFSGDINSNQYTFPNGIDIQVGKEYIIEIDGVEYVGKGTYDNPDYYIVFKGFNDGEFIYDAGFDFDSIIGHLEIYTRTIENNITTIDSKYLP